MSLRRLYKSIPKSKRICSYYRCQKPILRNIDQDGEGRIYHHGCLMAAQDERFRCLDCYAVFDGTEVVVSEDFNDRLTLICPYCGSANIRRLRG